MNLQKLFKIILVFIVAIYLLNIVFFSTIGFIPTFIDNLLKIRQVEPENESKGSVVVYMKE